MVRHNSVRYKEISHYAAIGNLRSVALVALDGSVDWCCFPELSDDAIFAALLDSERGGSFRIAPLSHVWGKGGRDPTSGSYQRYIPDTNVLETHFDTRWGKLLVTDFMPLRGSLDGVGKSETRPELTRIVRAIGGPIEVLCHWAPRPGFGKEPPMMRHAPHGVVAEGSAGERVALAGLSTRARLVDDGFGPVAQAVIRVEPGMPLVLSTRWGVEETAIRPSEAFDDLERTVEAWQGWCHRHAFAQTREWASPYSEYINRSELVLKLLIHGDTGAIAAAATTSLPETLGGERNWDYRYTWVRDASLTVQALSALGHRYAALDFLQFLHGALRPQAAQNAELRIMYGLHAEADLPEYELRHLEGYRASSPVRVGNAASTQTQHDVYGELLSAAYELIRQGVRLPSDLWLFLSRVADLAATHWRKPDAGIWEFRDKRQFIHSKGMVWVALDRATHLGHLTGLPGDRRRWRRVAREVRAYTLEEGFNPELGSFVQSAGSSVTDAANLRLLLHEILPLDDPRVHSTLERTMQELLRNGLLYRYRDHDGLPGDEGAFGITTCWLIDVLAVHQRLDEAYELFEGLLSRANHVLLFSEQIDPMTGTFLGNFPQAFSHLGLINSALYLAYCAGLEPPLPAPVGTSSHRQEGRPEGYWGDRERLF